jgi:hypothetical protein
MLRHGRSAYHCSVCGDEGGQDGVSCSVAAVVVVENERDAIIEKVVEAYGESSEPPRQVLRSATQKVVLASHHLSLPPLCVCHNLRLVVHF